MGLNWIIETLNQFGFEGEIEYLLKKNGVLFSTGLLDLSNIDTDYLTYFGCACIQNTKIANYKKQLTTTIDVLSPKDINDKPILPAPTLKFLRKATPINKQSLLQTATDNTMFVRAVNYEGDTATPVYLNKIKNIVTSEIANTTTFIEDYSLNYGYNPLNWTYDLNNFKVLKAKKNLLNTKIQVKLNLDISYDFLTQGLNSVLHGFLVKGTTGGLLDNISFTNTDNSIRFFDSIYLGAASGITSQSINQTFDIDMGNIPIDGNLWFVFRWESTSRFAQYRLDFKDSSIKIIASETSLDSIISGVRYIDMIKQCSKFINNLPINAQIFNTGGEHYNNICYNRGLLSTATGNEIVLTTNYNPEGAYIGQVVTNTIDNGIMPKGRYFWDGTFWISLNGAITQTSLTDASTPAGTYQGQVVFNNSDVLPTGLAYWSDRGYWVGLEQNKPFVTSFQDVAENAMTIETCSDYEIKQDKIYFGKYPDFYEDVEVGVFNIMPSKEYKVSWNEKFKINNVKIAYDTFETNRLSENTNEDMHTETEWNIPNNYVENKFDRSVKYIRSAMSAQVMIDLETTKPQTAFENDEKVFIEAITELPAGTHGGFSANLSMSIVSGNLQILNRDSNGDTNNVVINWNQQGFEVGSTISILSGENVGTYTVVSFTNSLLILSGGSPAYTGDSFIKLDWIYEGILWQTKTHEGYVSGSITGLNSPLNYPNLDYTPKDSLLNWGSYLKSACLAHLDSKIKKLKFRNESKLQKQKIGGVLQVQKADVLISDLPNPLITAKIFDLEVYASFTEMVTLLETLGVTRGYVRCLDEVGNVTLGYIRDLDYLWKHESLKLTIEEKWQPIILEATTLNYSWYKITGNYVVFFDINDLPLRNATIYSNISINGVVYDSIELLQENLLLI